MKGNWLTDSLSTALYEAVAANAPEKRLAVAFSGGVDSSLLAKISADLGKEVVLITVGFPGSHDIEFSKRIATMLGLPQIAVEIDPGDFIKKLDHVRQAIECENTSHIENCLAFLYVSAAANQNDLRIVLSANGCDELFCGYNGYRLAYAGGPEALAKLMEEKIANEFQLMEEISILAGEFGVTVRQPFLAPKFIAFAKAIPISSKIAGADDMLRKHVLRQVALQIGVPEESALKPKKAIQYGSLIHKNFQKARSTK